MPWNTREVMTLKEEFVSRAKEENISKLCREYKISRPTAYKWISRYENEGMPGLFERSKRPLSIPIKTSDSITSLILATRDRYPAWGARKLRQILINAGHQDLPSEKTFNRVLQRSGKIDPKESEKRQPYIRFEKKNPNELWQMDFKGHFEIIEGRCHPLTVLDDCSRFSICLKACAQEDEVSVRSGLEKAFHDYGLPDAMTMDNGSPWKGSVGQRFSTLTIWLMRLGIKIYHSRPYHPQTQGKDERFHRSLKEELLRFQNFRDMIDAQKNFDEWRYIYNHIRPHEALDLRCPAQKYVTSSKKFPTQLLEPNYKPDDQVRKVRNGGSISFMGENYFLGESLSGECVGLRQRGERKWDIYYFNNWLGSFEQKV